MRLGKRPKKSRAWKKAGLQGKPSHITSETVVGQVSADLIGTYFAPRLTELASESLRQYADVLLEYEDEIRAIKNIDDSGSSSNQNNSGDDTIATTREADIGVDGSVHVDNDRASSASQQPILPPPPNEPLFASQTSIDDLINVLSDTSDYFCSTKHGGWKVHANAAKFERTLDEKYGVFRPFITDHPEIERFLRSVQRKIAQGHASPIRPGPPPIPRTTAVVLLFMMQRGKLRWEILVLATLFFLVGLQPWALVAVVGIAQWLLQRRTQRPVGTMARSIPVGEAYYAATAAALSQDDTTNKENVTKQKGAFLSQPVGAPRSSKETLDDTSDYDVILLGTGPGALYAAALLSRAGRKVLVLSSAEDASGCLTLKTSSSSSNNRKLATLPFDVNTCNVSYISRQQQLLAPALATTTDSQGGIRFAKIGSAVDGHAFEILSIPGVGTESPDQHVPFVLRAGGVAALMDDAAEYLGDNWPAADGIGDSLTGQYVAACSKLNASASEYYLTKLLPDSVTKMTGDSDYHNAALRSCTAMLNACFPLNPHLRSLLAGIGMKGENRSPSQTSLAAHVTTLCGCISKDGMHYPVGGPRALCHALATVVEQNGGRVVTQAAVAELLFDESVDRPKSAAASNDEEPVAPWCVGVQLVGGQTVRFAADRYGTDRTNPVVVSMEGFIQTFIRYLPDATRAKYKVPRGIPALSERRPLVHLLFVLRGTAEDLNVTGADFYRLPGAAIALDKVDEATGGISYGTIGWEEDEENKDGQPSSTVSETANEESATSQKASNMGRKRRQNKFETGSSWIHISFPSAKDPSFTEHHGNVTTCVVTIEADDELVTLFDTKPKIYVFKKQTAASGGEQQRLVERVRKDLFNLYPQLSNKVEHAEVRGPFPRGLCHNPERYAARGVRAETPYPGLYAGGSDLTVGDSVSGSTVGGWLVANAVCGYSAVDHLFLKKNITTDLGRFLEPPNVMDDEDIAVPYTPPHPPSPPSQDEIDALNEALESSREDSVVS